MPEIQKADPSIYGNIQAPKGMSLSEMLGIQKSQYELSKLKELYPAMIEKEQALSRSAQIESNIKEKSSPFTIRSAEAAATGAEITTNTSQLDNVNKHFTNIVNKNSQLMKKADLNKDDIVKGFTSTWKNGPNANNPAALDEALKDLPEKATPTQYKAWLTQKQLQTLTAQEQFEKQYPAVQLTNLGAKVAPITTGNPLIANQPVGQQVGQGVSTSLPPQIFANQITGAPQVLGGGGGGGGVIPQNNVVQQSGGGGGGGTTIIGGTGGGGGSGVKPQMMLNRPTQLRQGENESPANFNARVADTQNLYKKALDQINNVNSEFGHIPTIQTINEHILTGLKNPKVDTGAIADYLAGKTNKGSLSSESQELAKYLEQRIQRLSPKSDADAASKKSAYGSFNLKKEALRDLVRQDQAWVTTQDLFAKGTKNNALIGGSASNPSYGNVADFNAEFSEYAKNPTLMKYIAIVGENPKLTKHLDKTDIEDLSKAIGRLSKEERTDLELQRQKLLNLVNGIR